MNYFLILGIIVIVVFFMGILVNNISKIVQQSETKDIVFTLIGFMLALSILVSFSIVSYTLENAYYKNVNKNVEEILLVPDVKASTDHFICILLDNELVNIHITPNTKHVNNSFLRGNIKFQKITYEAPNVWYMMNWRVEALNRYVLYVADVIYD